MNVVRRSGDKKGPFTAGVDYIVYELFVQRFKQNLVRNNTSLTLVKKSQIFTYEKVYITASDRNAMSECEGLVA